MDVAQTTRLRHKLILADNPSLSKLDVANAHDGGMQRRALLRGSAGGAASAQTVEVACAGRLSSASRSDTGRNQTQRQSVKKSGTCRVCGTL